MIKTESVKFKGSMDRLKSVMSQRDVFHKYNKKFKTDMKVIARSIKSILNEEVPFDIKKIFLGCDFTIELYFDVKTDTPFIRCFILGGYGFWKPLLDNDTEEQVELRNAEYKRLFPKFVKGGQYHNSTLNGLVRIKSWKLNLKPDFLAGSGMEDIPDDALYPNEYISRDTAKFISEITKESMIDCISDYSTSLIEKSSKESYSFFVGEVLNSELMVEDLLSEKKILDFIQSAIFDELGIPKYKNINIEYLKYISYEALYSSLEEQTKGGLSCSINYIDNLKNIGIWRELSELEKEKILSLILKRINFKNITKISAMLRHSGVVIKDTTLFDFLFEKYNISSPTIKIDFIVKSAQKFNSLTSEEFESLDSFYKFKYLNLSGNII